MKSITLAIVALAIGLGAARTNADQTNLVQNVRVQLYGISQGGTSTNGSIITTAANFTPVDTRRVIAALGTATGNTFSFASRLVLVTPLGGGAPSVQVRDGSNTVDVTGFVVYQSLSGTVEESFENTRTGRAFSTDYSVQQIALQDNGGYPSLTLHFNVTGLAVLSSASRGGNLNINAVGTGDSSGNSLILQGTISLSGGTLEVVSGGGGGIQS
jgi:hypothetical protein